MQISTLKIQTKKSILLLFSSIIFCGVPPAAFSQKNIKIFVTNEDTTLSPDIIAGFENIIYKVYPKLMKDFNKKARTDITVKIDTTYDGVAYAHNGQVTVSSQWLHKKPEDLDLMTHEIMHIIQSYSNNAGPGWLTEGIADFVRYKYGVDNTKAGWSLPNFSNDHSYKNSYRVTARFLLWVSQNYDKKIVYKLDKKLRAKDYTPELWEKYTKLNVDQLWDAYSKNSNLKP